MIRITLQCSACDGYGYHGSSDLSSNKTTPCYECNSEGLREIIDDVCQDAVEAMDEYPDWVEIEV